MIDLHIRPLRPGLLGKLADLFNSSRTTRGCWCMWFLLSGSERRCGWGRANRSKFENLARTADPPLGILACHEGVPVGWCALGPRSRYPAAIGKRAILLRERDPSEDNDV